MKKLSWTIYAALSLALLVGVPLIFFAATRPSQTVATELVTGTKIQPGISQTQTLSATECPTLIGEFQGAVGVYAKNLKTGQVLMLNPDGIFAAASTIKVPVSIVVYRHLYNQAGPAKQALYDTGVELMMTVSENDYFADFLNEIEEAIGSDVISEHFSQLGMKHTTIRDDQARKDFGYSNVTTAQDMAIIFEQLYLGKLISPEKTALMLDSMARSIFPDEIARYMQQRKVIHKIGELDDVLADVGIVEGTNGPVLISIFTATPRDVNYASDYIAAMSACLYSRLSGGEQTDWKKPAI